MNRIPCEFTIAGVYLPPMLVAGCLGVLLAWGTARLLNRRGLSRHFFYPPLVFVALAVIYTAVVGLLLVPF
jgi:uncharacterized membrane protein SpoIIM required for sporulation